VLIFFISTIPFAATEFREAGEGQPIVGRRDAGSLHRLTTLELLIISTSLGCRGLGSLGRASVYQCG
jgi:hypothetical protein